jgi:hypothetical protein
MDIDANDSLTEFMAALYFIVDPFTEFPVRPLSISFSIARSPFNFVSSHRE